MNGLNAKQCRVRQERLRERLRELDMDAALLTESRHVFCFTGHYNRLILPCAAVVFRDGGATLLASMVPPADTCAHDEHLKYEGDRLCTMKDDLAGAMFEMVTPRLRGLKRIGCDAPIWAVWTVGAEQVDLRGEIQRLRRRKDADEVALIRRALKGAEAAYGAAKKAIRPGLTEIEVYALMQAAAINALGEPIGELGNDYQSGQFGGPPRTRAMEAGELIPLDIGITIRGYTSDVSRTFAVDGRPTALQLKAHARIMEYFAHVESTFKAGLRCQDVFAHAKSFLDGYSGFSFFHHLGHGTGQFAHEQPRLNPNWDDVLEVGDVITVEPGLYHEDLRAGMRIENDYLVSDGVERLIQFSMDL